jgi:hypothetical protein
MNTIEILSHASTCINIKEDVDTYANNIILVQHGAKLKWGTR